MEKYYKMLEEIENNRMDITKLYLLSSINMVGKNQKEEWKMANYCYDVWLNDDNGIDLNKLADCVVENWEDIENDEITDIDIIEYCLDY